MKTIKIPASVAKALNINIESKSKPKDVTKNVLSAFNTSLKKSIEEGKKGIKARKNAVLWMTDLWERKAAPIALRYAAITRNAEIALEKNKKVKFFVSKLHSGQGNSKIVHLKDDKELKEEYYEDGPS